MMKLYEKNSFLKKLLPLLLLGILLVSYTAMLLVYMIPVTGGTDQNGYHVCAKMLLKDGTFYQKPVDDLQFIGSMWVMNGRGEFYPKYPPLYPFLASRMSLLLGDGGGFYATVWGAILAVAGMYFLARVMRFSRYMALFGSFLLACSPVITALGITKNSHTPSLAMLVWGLAFFLLGARKKHFSFLFAMLGGFLIGCTVGIRYTDFLMIFVPLVWGLVMLRGKKRIVLLAALLLGAAIPYGAMGVFHALAYGAPWRSGYSLTDESSAFEWRFILTNLQIYLPGFFTMAAGPAAVLALFSCSFRLRSILFWCAWIVPTSGLYLTYYWAPEGNGTGALRFLVPVIPAALLLTLFALEKFRNFIGKHALFFSAVIVLALLQGVWGWMEGTRLCEGIHSRALGQELIVDFAVSRIPEKSIVIANTGILTELDYEKRWSLYGSYLMNPREIRNMVDRSLQCQAAGLQHARAKLLNEKLGKLDYGKLQTFLRDFLEKQQKKGKEVYFIGRTYEANNFRRTFYRSFEIEKISVLTAQHDPWVLRRLKPDASRYVQKKILPAAYPATEILKLGRRRDKILSQAESEQMLYSERSQILSRINPERDPFLQDDLTRLESLRDEISSLRRSAYDQKRRAEFRKKQLLEQKLRREKQRELEKRKILERKRRAEEAARRRKTSKWTPPALVYPIWKPVLQKTPLLPPDALRFKCVRESERKRLTKSSVQGIFL